MRRSLALASAVCLIAVTACESTSEPSDGTPETVEELTEDGLVGLALVHRGFEAGDPETEQVLVFHDPDTGAPVQRIDLPDGALDPMASALPVHKQFSEDWHYFAFVTAEPNAVNLAVLTDPRESGTEDPGSSGGSGGEDGEGEAFSYQPVESIPAAGGETLSAPVIHGDRLWFASAQGDGQPPKVMSVPLEAPAGTPSQEGSLALGEGQRPSDWTLTPDGSLHIRNSVPTEQVTGGDGNLVVRSTSGSVVNATLSTGGEQWQTFDDAPVWGGERALLRPDGNGEGGPNGAYLLEVEGQGHTTTRLLEDEPSPVVQYTLAPDRDAILLQTEEKWFRVDLEDGAVTETEEAFPRYHDTSMDGWPLVVRWSQEPPADADAEPDESPSP